MPRTRSSSTRGRRWDGRRDVIVLVHRFAARPITFSTPSDAVDVSQPSVPLLATSSTSAPSTVNLCHPSLPLLPASTPNAGLPLLPPPPEAHRTMQTLLNLYHEVDTTCDRDGHSNKLVLWKKQRLRKDWKKFCKMMNHPRDDVDLDQLAGVRELWTPPPALNHVKAFLCWYAQNKKGLLDQKITVQTLTNDWDYLRRDITASTGFEYTRVEKNEVKFFIEKELKETENLSTKARKKGLADRLVIEDVLDFLWQRDEFVYRDPRVRVQIAMGILFIWYMGVRTGEFSEGSSSRPNEGLLWKDFNISLVYDSTPTFHIQVQLRNRKGKKGKESAFQTENFREDKHRWRCPVTLLLALAIEDKALDRIETVDDLRAIRFSEHRAKVDLKIRDEMRDIPVLRKLQGHIMSRDEIVSGTTFAQLLCDLGVRAGYVDALQPYAIRRGFGNRLDKELTEAERSRQMGHQNPTTFQYYMSQSAPCDVQGIMNESVPDQERVDFFRSMRSNIDRSAPKQRQSSLAEPRSRQHTERDEAPRKQVRTRREEHFAQANPFEGHATHPGQTIRKPLERKSPSRLLQNFLHYDVDRSRVIEVMYGTADCDIYTAVEAVAGLLGRKDHLSVKETLQKERLRGGFHCYMCTAHLDTAEAWNAHCTQHLDDCGLLCGRVSRQGAVLWPGLCPFCLGREDMRASDRLRQFLNKESLLLHVEKSHIREADWPLDCPHPHCNATQIATRDLFWDHMHAVHGYPVSQARTMKPKPEVNDPEASNADQNGGLWDCPYPECAALAGSIKTQGAYMHHAATHNMRPCAWKGCKETFRSSVTLRSHLHHTHKLSEHVCKLPSFDTPGEPCGQACETAGALKVHHNAHVRREQRRCPEPECRKSCRSRISLAKHMRDAHGTPEGSWPGSPMNTSP